MTMTEIRKHYFLDKWVIVAEKRRARPKPTIVEKTAEAELCFFCPGNERLTPPASLAYVLEGNELKKAVEQGDQRVKNWLIRCFPNKYPALTPQAKLRRRNDWLKAMAARGFHEVLVETPNHNADLDTIEEEQLALALSAIFERARHYASQSFVKYISIFKNSGVAAGASISHPHTQLATLPFVPEEVAYELKVLKRYEKDGVCALCEVVEKEKLSERVVFREHGYLVLSPWASIFPYEMWILPEKHLPTPFNLSNEEISSLAKVLKRAFKALFRALGKVPYNLVYKIPPIGEYGFYHWRIEVYPRLSIHAGFELSTGVVINTVSPEKAAEDLRSCLS
ncbi:MAG: sulfate adenylyltransferase [Candidatus Methanomethylicota archaeon]|uniref:Sulfate adenylyltransferase n=1 Tax=Thermoproteota archaeon TaxID=2056631 RepID=A0A497F3I9_9CREN|nr:MAG: sulfate adenylyltransferase [Candidatus Verstraetearchaeota archaeon]